MHPNPVLSLHGVSKFYGGVRAVLDVSMNIFEGEILGLIGPNGAGKSTLAGVVVGSLSPSNGKVVFDGRDVTKLSRRERARLGIANTHQLPRTFPSLTVGENLEVSVARHRKGGSTDRVVATAELIGLAHLLDTRASKLSHGQKRLLEIGMAIISEPRLLVVDEPSQGLTGGEVAALASILGEIRSKLSVMLIDHRVDFVASLSSRVAVMSKGRIVALGPASDSAVSEKIEEAYLRGS